MNVINQDQVLREGTIIEHGQPTVWAAPIDDQKPEPRWKQGLCKQLGEVIMGARPNLSIREAQALEELIADHQDVFKKAVTMGTKRCTIGSIPATPGPFASHHKTSVSEESSGK
jgi:hypothetical protein